jgi:hypothetical protein
MKLGNLQTQNWDNSEYTRGSRILSWRLELGYVSQNLKGVVFSKNVP